LAEALLAEGIETKKYFYPPLHKQRLYSSFQNVQCAGLTHTDYVTDGVLSLPIYESLPDATVERVAYAILRLAQFKASEKQAFTKESHQHVAARS